MKRILLVAFAILVASSTADAQPVVSGGWRPPVGCSTGQALVFNGTIWACGSVSAFSTNNVIPKGNGTGLTSSSLTDDGTTFAVGSRLTSTSTVPLLVTQTGTAALRVAKSTSTAEMRLAGGSNEIFQVGNVANVTTVAIGPSALSGTAELSMTSSAASFATSAYGTTDDTYFGWDGQSGARIGFTKKVGAVGKLTYGSGNSFTIAQSSAASIAASGTFTDRFAINSSGNIGLGNGAAASAIAAVDLYTTNAGQVTAALTDAGSRSGMLTIQDGGSATNTGGALCFGNSSSHTANVIGWACIKGLVQSGAGNTIGDLAFSTRNATGDTALTERMRITGGGDISMNVGGVGTTTFNNALTAVTGNVTVGNFAGTPANATITTGQQDNYALGANVTILRVDGTAGMAFTGFTGGRAGREFWIYNVDAIDSVRFHHETASTAANRITMTGGVGNFSDLAPSCGIHFTYDGTTSRWVQDIISCYHLPGAIFDQAVTANAGLTTTTLTASSTSNLQGNTTMDGAVTQSSAGATVTINGYMSGKNAGGYNGVGGRRQQWWDEFWGVAPTSSVGTYADGFLQTGTTGLGSWTMATPGTLTGTPDTTSGNRLYMKNPVSLDAISMQSGSTWIAEVYATFSVINNGAPNYWWLFGFGDSTTINQTDGCWFQYDDGNVATAPGTGNANSASTDKWECWCASNSVRTGYLLDGSTVTDGSFTSVNAPVDITGDRLKIIYLVNTRADFYVNDTKVCQITSNLPSASLRKTSPLTLSAIVSGGALTFDLEAVNYVYEQPSDRN